MALLLTICGCTQRQKAALQGEHESPLVAAPTPQPLARVEADPVRLTSEQQAQIAMKVLDVVASSGDPATRAILAPSTTAPFATGDNVASGSMPARPGVSHVVICWLKEPGNVEARRKVIDASERLRAIPGVIDVYAGQVLPSERPVVDSSFDVGFIFTFKDKASMKAYVTSPEHQKALAEILRPNVDHYRVFDLVAAE
jgi:hypothetical protein